MPGDAFPLSPEQARTLHGGPGTIAEDISQLMDDADSLPFEEYKRRKDALEERIKALKMQSHTEPASEVLPPPPVEQPSTRPIPEPLAQALENGMALILKPGDRVLILVSPQATPGDVQMLKGHLQVWAPDVNFMVMAGPIGMMNGGQPQEVSPLSKLILP